MSDGERDPTGAPPAGPVEGVAGGEGAKPASESAPAEPAPAAAPAEAPAAAPKPARPALTPEEKAAAVEKAKAAAAAKAAAGGGAEAKPAAKPKPAHEDDSHKPVWERDPVAPEWKDAADDPLVTALREELPEAIESARTLAGDLTLAVARDRVVEVARALKEKHGFTYLIDVCGADFPKREPRFDVVYHAYSFAANRRVRLKVATDEATPVPSVSGVWRAAGWSEREAYDMYGVRFSGHPDLTRILLWEGFNGYPLRKDFPVEGIDTGSAIYPEYYEPSAGPVAGTGTGWKPTVPKAPAGPAVAPTAPAPAAKPAKPAEPS